jgi:hypothetical protein
MHGVSSAFRLIAVSVSVTVVYVKFEVLLLVLKSV